MDLLSDDGDGVVEMSLLEELEKRRGNGSNKCGCCVAFLLLGSSLLIAGWCMSRVL